ncbi:AimR family lysis-lysogeny pheromone receptor [Alkalihalobacillus sp. LMS6]|jgi:hypothetical protein|uniref:AimR family lysis-lysogeny pheromone receptor n=1 Tax=Alkalihalobacillus sp. LMS6 TaxID=2924034 RepID=UPI0020D19C41|nr:AimR family lysis-lysogeny pheromone receptor [Alkalihalobacillus sp. LMS6]UTR05194.1 AimR family lysis-lysogeny pheromone receptor [Alkalihalobacillus sp. LMS6]
MQYVESLSNAMIENNIKQVDIIKATGLKKAHVSKIVAGSIEPGFLHLFSVIKYVMPERLTEVMDEFSLEVSNKESIMSSFEYATYYDRVELLKSLMSIYKESSKRDMQEFVSVYELVNSDKKPDDLIELYREVYGSLKSKEMQVKVYTCESLLYYRSNDVITMIKMAERIISKVSDLNETFFKYALAAKIKAAFATGSLYNEGDIHLVREVCDEVISNPVTSNMTLAATYHTLGHSYLYENHPLALKNLETAVNFYELCGNKGMVNEVRSNDIPFLNNIHNMTFDLTNVCAEERLHYYARKGDRENFNQVISKIDDLSTPYIKSYTAMMDKDLMNLFEAHISFLRMGNLFFAKFVQLATEKFKNEEEIVI